MLTGHNIDQVGMFFFNQIRVCEYVFPRWMTPPGLQCRLPLSHWFEKNFGKQKTHKKQEGENELLVGVQPPPCCSFARHLAGKMVIYCSFAHH